MMISEWAKQMMVNFNPSKSEAILFSNKSLTPPSLLFNGIPVQFVDSHKHLGLTLSYHGKWHEHVKSISKSSSKVLGIMRLLKFKIRRDFLNQIYISLLRPILEYVSVVWDNCTVIERESLEKYQNEAARIVTGVTRSISIDNLYKEIGWLSLSDIHTFSDCPFFCKGLIPNFLKQMHFY